MRHSLSAITVALSASAVFLLLMVPKAQAQGGSCHDPWINSAYNQMYHRAPQGSGNSGECNIYLYGHGHWSSFANLEAEIRAAKAPAGCRDPWITSAYNQMYHRAPQGSGDSGECNIALYGGGHWSSFPDLENKIRASKAGSPPVTAKVDSSGNLINLSNGRLLARSGTFLIANGTGNNIIAPRAGQIIQIAAGVIAPGGGNVIAPGGGNVIAAGGGNVIAAGGGNFRVQSVGGKTLIPATSVH